MKRVAVLLLIVAILNIRGSAQRTDPNGSDRCLHEQSHATTQDSARRDAAILFARAVNTAQWARRTETRHFERLNTLPVRARSPVGFETQLTVDPDTYVLVLRDTLDRCNYTVVSTQDGIIIEGASIKGR